MHGKPLKVLMTWWNVNFTVDKSLLVYRLTFLLSLRLAIGHVAIHTGRQSHSATWTHNIRGRNGEKNQIIVYLQHVFRKISCYRKLERKIGGFCAICSPSKMPLLKIDLRRASIKWLQSEHQITSVSQIWRKQFFMVAYIKQFLMIAFYLIS
jgi:hypothetical protein